MHKSEWLKRYVTSLSVLLSIEILGVVFLIFGILPREAAFFLTGIFVFFVLFAPLKEAVFFAVFSIPLYIALPISESFDSMASWRIIVAVLFLRFLFAKLSESDPKKLLANLLRTRLGVLLGLFFLVGILSLLVAQAPMFGIKKLAYLANIFGLFFVIQATVKNRGDFTAVLKYALGGFLVALAVGYAQFVAVLFVPLYSFWQWWAEHVIPVFYGAELSRLLSHANTWFSYYKDAEPTLRMFSVFPDSHSFALFSLLALPMALAYYFARKSNKKSTAISKVVIVLALLAIIFSGTRGVWVAAGPVFVTLVLAYFYQKEFFRKNFPVSTFVITRVIMRRVTYSQPQQLIIKTCIFAFLTFALLFPVASQIQKISQWRQGGKISGTTIFSRISTSFSAEELSNKGRIQIWKSTLSSIAKRPFFGVGIGNYPLILGENVSATKKGASAHSLYLDVIGEMGIFAGIILVLIFLEILWQAFKVWRDSSDLIFSAFGGFFAISFLWVMAYSVVDVVLLNDKVLLLCTTLAALLYAVPKIKSSEA